MMTRCGVHHQYGHGGYAAPPYHASMHPHQHAPLPQRDGLAGGAVILRMPANTFGGTGYGYLGMDPSDPASWPRRFAPTSGMISYLNGEVR